MLSKKEIVINAFVICCLAAFCTWYAFDAYRASDSLDNLILVLPIAILVLLLCLFQFFVDIWGKVGKHAKSASNKHADADKKEKSEKDDIMTVLPVIVIFAFYVLTLEYLGFDVGTVLFLGIFLLYHGERRIPWVLGYSLVYGLLVAYFFSAMLPYPMPMMILPTDY